MSSPEEPGPEGFPPGSIAGLGEPVLVNLGSVLTQPGRAGLLWYTLALFMGFGVFV